jgi:hypothetical protein
MSGDLLTGFMLKHGWENDSNGELKIKDTAAYDRLKESVEKSGNKSLLEGLEAHEMFVMNSPGIKTTEAGNLQHRKNAADGIIQSFDVSRDASGNWSKGTAGNMVAGTRVHTKNYAKAKGDLEALTATRSAGTTTTAKQNSDAAKAFISNNGALADYFKSAQTGATDTIPVDTIKREIEDGASFGFEALNNGDTKKANDDLKIPAKILSQLDQQGVTDAQQIPALASLTEALKDQTGKINADIIRKIDRLVPEIRDAVIKSAELTKKRADDILRNGVKNAQEQAVVDLADAISKEIDANKKNVNARILNAYRPGRDRRAP